jgi:hypothetical protein
MHFGLFSLHCFTFQLLLPSQAPCLTSSSSSGSTVLPKRQRALHVQVQTYDVLRKFYYYYHHTIVLRIHCDIYKRSYKPDAGGLLL